MYNKLFTKILDSSIWLQDDQTIRVWITLLASMDEDGFAHFASPMNLAARARVTLEDTARIVAYLEAPDEFSGNPEHEGRRIERTHGGWIVLNAKAHRDLVTRREAMARHRERQAAYRNRKRDSGDVTQASQIAECDAGDVTKPSPRAKSDGAMPESEAVSEAYTNTRSPIAREKTARSPREGFEAFWQQYPRKVARQAALKAWSRIGGWVTTVEIMAGLDRAMRSEQWLRDGGQYVPHAATWLNGGRWADDLPAASTSVPGPAAAVPAQRVDPCFGMQVPFTRGGVVWWRWYDWICHQYAGRQITEAEFEPVRAQWAAYQEGQKQ